MFFPKSRVPKISRFTKLSFIQTLTMTCCYVQNWVSPPSLPSNHHHRIYRYVRFLQLFREVLLRSIYVGCLFRTRKALVYIVSYHRVTRVCTRTSSGTLYTQITITPLSKSSKRCWRFNTSRWRSVFKSWSKRQKRLWKKDSPWSLLLWITLFNQK